MVCDYIDVCNEKMTELYYTVRCLKESPVPSKCPYYDNYVLYTPMWWKYNSLRPTNIRESPKFSEETENE